MSSNCRFYVSKDRKGDHNYPWLIVLVSLNPTSYYTRVRTGEDAIETINLALNHEFFLGYPL